MSDMVMCYNIHGEDHRVIEQNFKRGRSVESLEQWAKDNNIDDYTIYLAMWEVERRYIFPLKKIKQISKNITQHAGIIESYADISEAKL